MTKPISFTGLDIGSSRISAVAAEADDRQLFKILAHASSPSRGVSRGMFVDLNEAANAVSKTLTRLCGKLSKRPGAIYVNITGATLKGERSKGMTPLSARGREITRSDINKCVKAASIIKLPFDREVVYKVVHNFYVDEGSGVKNPLGLYASRLACDIYMITSGVNHIQNIYKCVNNAGYDVSGLVFGGLAEAESVLEPSEKEEGAALLNLGASLTEFSVFLGGVLNDLDVIPFGARDLKSGFENDRGFKDLLAKIKGKLDEFLNREIRIKSLVVTGGMATGDGIIEFLEKCLGCPVRMGIVKNIRGDISSFESVGGTTSIGLARHAYLAYENRVSADSNFVKRMSDKFVDIINNYF